MPFDTLRQMLRQESPAFRCYYAGDRSQNLGFTAHVRHLLGEPATAAALAQLDSQLGVAGASLRGLFSLHDRMTLFRDTKSDAAGLELFAIADWPSKTVEMRELLEAMGVDLADMPEWFNTGVVIGQVPESANYFVVGTAGDSAGRLYYVDHDGFVEDPIADDAEALMDSLVVDPAQFMYDRGCYTRYSDGETNKQWIPKQYVNAANS